MTNGETSDGGSMMRDSTEVLELLHPIRVWADRIVPDTEGAGRFRGAPSLYIEYGPVDTELEVLYTADGTVNPAFGARGGRSTARCCGPYMRTAQGEVVELEAWARVVLEPGETIISISSAGGGYGPPTEREPERVRNDLAEGWVTPSARPGYLRRSSSRRTARSTSGPRRRGAPSSRRPASRAPRRGPRRRRTRARCTAARATTCSR